MFTPRRSKHKLKKSPLQQLFFLAIMAFYLLLLLYGDNFSKVVAYLTLTAMLITSYFFISTSPDQSILITNNYSKFKKFSISLLIILASNALWIPSLFWVDFSARLLLSYSFLPEEVIENLGITLLIFLPLLTNIATFYRSKNFIISYKDYFKASSTLILLFIPFLAFVDSYWPLGILLQLKDPHSWGLIITAPLFRFLIEVHTMEDSKDPQASA